MAPGRDAARGRATPAPALWALSIALATLGYWLAPRGVLALRAFGGPAVDYRFGAADQLGGLGRLAAVACGGLVVLLAFASLSPSPPWPSLRARLAGVLAVAGLRLAGALLMGGLIRMAATALGRSEPWMPWLLGAVGLWSALSAAAIPLAALGWPAGAALAQSMAWAGRHPLSAALLLAVEWLPGLAIWAKIGYGYRVVHEAERLAGLPLALWDPGAQPALIGPAHALALALAFVVWGAVAGMLARHARLPRIEPHSLP